MDKAGEEVVSFTKNLKILNSYLQYVLNPVKSSKAVIKGADKGAGYVKEKAMHEIKTFDKTYPKELQEIYKFLPPFSIFNKEQNPFIKKRTGDKQSSVINNTNNFNISIDGAKDPQEVGIAVENKIKSVVREINKKQQLALLSQNNTLRVT